MLPAPLTRNEQLSDSAWFSQETVAHLCLDGGYGVQHPPVATLRMTMCERCMMYA